MTDKGPRRMYDETRHLEPLEPGEKTTVDQMFFTQCPICGPVNDWSQTHAEARTAARRHAADHARRVYVPYPTR
jgi:hypothetical protein